MLGIVMRNRGWVGKELQEVWVDGWTPHALGFFCVLLLHSGSQHWVAGSSLDSKIPASEKSDLGKCSPTREMGSEPYHW